LQSATKNRIFSGILKSATENRILAALCKAPYLYWHFASATKNPIFSNTLQMLAIAYT
jgi:hypothetical protein